MNGFGFNPLPEKQLGLGFDPETFFGNLIPKDTKELSGPQMIELFKKGAEAGFKNEDLQGYLKRRGIRIIGNSLPGDDQEAFEYKSFGTGNDLPRTKRR